MSITAIARISKNFRETCFGYDPTLGAEDYDEFKFEIQSSGRGDEDLELVYAILNSYPNEIMGDAAGYEQIIEAYRTAGHRSLSVGDLVTIDEATFAVGRFGFDLAEGFVG